MLHPLAFAERRAGCSIGFRCVRVDHRGPGNDQGYVRARLNLPLEGASEGIRRGGMQEAFKNTDRISIPVIDK
jgi:hypothetical protein